MQRIKVRRINTSFGFAFAAWLVSLDSELMASKLLTSATPGFMDSHQRCVPVLQFLLLL